MVYRQTDPAELEGEELADWYLRTPDEIAEERASRQQRRRDEFFGGGRWQEARYRPPAPRTAPVRPPPPETRAAPQSKSAPSRPGEPDGYFANYRPDVVQPMAPPPLSYVETTVLRPDRFVVAGEGIVDAREVERIYAEQQRRINGPELEPSPYAHAVDRLQDGQVPLASQLEKGKWERDPTCHPYGGWEIDPGYPHYSKRSQDYEAQVTGARGVDYVVRLPGGERPVKFDGCEVDRKVLQEAKGPRYAALLESRFGRFVARGLERQAGRQIGAARGRPIEWYFAEEPARRHFSELEGTRPITAMHVPAR